MNNKQVAKLTELARTYGPKLIIYMILMDVLDDILLPAVLAFAGYPVLSGISFIADFDWLTYPLYFVFSALWQKIRSESV